MSKDQNAHKAILAYLDMARRIAVEFIKQAIKDSGQDHIDFREPLYFHDGAVCITGVRVIRKNDDPASPNKRFVQIKELGDGYEDIWWDAIETNASHLADVVKHLTNQVNG